MLTPSASLPNGGVVYTDRSGNSMTMVVGADGYPASLHANGSIVLFSNIVGGVADLALITPQGQVELRRGVALSRAFSRAPAGVFASLQGDRPNATLRAIDPRAALEWAGIAFGIASCAAATTAGFATVGVAIPLALVACGSTALAILGKLTNDEEMVEASRGLGGFNCVLPSGTSSCIDWVVERGVESGLSAGSDQSARRGQIEAALGALNNGGGSIQVTLNWGGSSDLDLRVTEPSGFEISWQKPLSPSGARLDRDNTVGGWRPENIFWSSGQDAAGTYRVRVQHYRGTAPEEYTVLVINGVYSRLYSGRIDPNSTVTVISFSRGIALSGLLARAEEYLQGDTDQPQKPRVAQSGP